MSHVLGNALGETQPSSFDDKLERQSSREKFHDFTPQDDETTDNNKQDFIVNQNKSGMKKKSHFSAIYKAMSCVKAQNKEDVIYEIRNSSDSLNAKKGESNTFFKRLRKRFNRVFGRRGVHNN